MIASAYFVVETLHTPAPQDTPKVYERRLVCWQIINQLIARCNPPIEGGEPQGCRCFGGSEMYGQRGEGGIS